MDKLKYISPKSREYNTIQNFKILKTIYDQIEQHLTTPVLPFLQAVKTAVSIIPENHQAEVKFFSLLPPPLSA